MNTRLAARAYLSLGAIAVSAVFALIATFAYGGFYAHDRYWEGTKKRVAEKDAALVTGLLSSPEARAAFPRDVQALAEIFKPLDGLLIVEVRLGNAVAYSNRTPEGVVGITLTRISLGESTPVSTDDHVLTISRYQSPRWWRRFGFWMSHPQEWFGTSYNQITGPFVAFFVLFLGSCIALGWRARAGHLEREVLPHLRSGAGG